MRHRTREDNEWMRFWAGVCLAIPVSVVLWATLLYGLLWLGRLAGVIR